MKTEVFLKIKLFLHRFAPPGGANFFNSCLECGEKEICDWDTEQKTCWEAFQKTDIYMQLKL